jgi:hypothetical protein
MKSRLLPFLLSVGIVVWCVTLAVADEARRTPAKPVPLTARIDALLRPHLNPPPLPVSLPNPFLVVRGTAEFTESSAAAPTPEARAAGPLDESGPVTDTDMLARGVAQLKIGGTMQINDVTQVMINRTTYKEGDFLTLETKPTPIHVQLVRLTREELTLRYNEATQAVRLKNAIK